MLLNLTSLNKEHIEQILIYMDYIDKFVKKVYHDKTIGIIITKHSNDFIVAFCNDTRISIGIKKESINFPLVLINNISNYIISTKYSSSGWYKDHTSKNIFSNRYFS